MLAALFLASCNDYDDTELWNKVNGLEERLAALEEWQQTTNNNLNALQTLINTMDYITSVSPIMQANDTIGYTINFYQSNPISIYNGTTSQIGITQDAEGNWLWTLDGEILTTPDGTPIQANGLDAAAPQLSIGKDLLDKDIKTDAEGDDIATDIAYLSVDGGETWYRVTGDKGEQGEKGEQGDKGNTGSTGPTGPAGPAGADGDSFFKDVDVQGDNVIFTLANGTTFTVQMYKGALAFLLGGTALTDLSTAIDLTKGLLTYTPAGAEVSARILEGEGWTASASSGTITITPGGIGKDAKATLEVTLLENGRVIETYQLTVTQAGLQGEGTAASPYTVSSPTELAYIAEQVNNNTQNYNGKYIKLTQDIKLTGEWEPIGPPSDESGYFAGTFDGDGHTISGLSISDSQTNTHGLFGKINSASVIKNLTIESPEVSGLIEVSALVGFNFGGHIENCHVRNATLTGKGKVGGLVGINSGGSITNCSATGTISGKGGNGIGGIVGMEDIFASLSSITSCWFDGEIKNETGADDKAGARAGGIIGECNSAVTIEACYSTGTFTIDSDASSYDSGLGSIAGSAINGSTLTLNACYSTAKLSSTGDATRKYVGGIVGYRQDVKPITPATISATSCYWSCEGVTYGLGSDNSNEGTTQVTGSDWSTAMTAMNGALSGTEWRYVANSGDTDIPLVIEKQTE